MNRLGVKLVLALVGVTLVTVILISASQLQGIVAENRSLPVPERSELNPSQVGRAVLFPRRVGHGAILTVVTFPPGSGTQAVEVQEAQAEPAGWVSAREVTNYLRGSLEQRAGTLIVSALLALALAVALALVLARVIARPIQTVAAAADRLAAGDLSARVPVAAGHAPLRMPWRSAEPPRSADDRTAGRAGADERPRPQGDETARLAHSFNVMADSLERLERQRRDMVADVAHELRTPLTVLRGRLEALEDGVVPLDIAEVADMHAQVLILTRLVEDLRVLSLADAGKLMLHPQELDLAEVARSAAAGYRLRAADKGVALVNEDAEPLLVSADRDRVLQVLGNLLDNALRYTPGGGRVTMRAFEDGEHAVIEVADTGPGIPEGSEERIFERFHRTDESRARSAGGSGLGLAIVRAIVESHGGTVGAGRGAEGGAVLRVAFPR